jgi:hypothetical protein
VADRASNSKTIRTTSGNWIYGRYGIPEKLDITKRLLDKMSQPDHFQAKIIWVISPYPLTIGIPSKDPFGKLTVCYGKVTRINRIY